MENIEDIDKSLKEHYSNPTIIVLDSILKKVGKMKLYKQWFVNGKHVRLEYSNRKDERGFVKFYIDKYLFNELQDFFPVSLVLLFYISDKLEMGKNSIALTRDAFLRDTNLSDGSFYKGLSQLLEKEWIFKSVEKNVYWINLYKFSKGSAEDNFKNFELNKAKEALI